MRKICFLTLAAGLAAGAGFGSVRATGPWEMAQQTAPEKWMPAVVPGTVLTTLVKNGLVPDPYWGLNNKIEMRKIPDLAENRAFYEAMFRTKVELPVGWTNRVVWMRPEGINYRSEIYLNGMLATSTRGMFARNAVDVSPYAKPGETNELVIKVWPVDHPGSTKQKPWGAPGEWFNGGDGEIGRDVTMLMSAGWDFMFNDGIRDRNTGIWKDIDFFATDKVRLDHPYVRTKLNADFSAAELTLEVDLQNAANGWGADVSGTLTAEVEGTDVRFAKKVGLFRGERRTERLTATLKQPKLWWPRNKGEQHLYELVVRYADGETGQVSDERRIRFGVRELTSDQSGKGGARQFFCNRRKIFIRGTNWIPEAMLKADDARMEREMRLTAESGVNLVRLWAGGIVESDRFYELCDEYGLLVWQEFWMTGDTKHPDDPGLYLDNVAQQVKRIRHHASLAHWVCSNESTEVDGIEALVKKLTGTTSWMMQSECGGVHDGSPYFPVNPMSYYEDTASPRGSRVYGFSPEYGTCALPAADQCRKFMPENLLWPMDVSAWKYREGGGFNKMTEFHHQAVNGYGKSRTFDEYCRKSQAADAALAKAFNPICFNADEWVQIARDAGMKYLVFTSKHHDGFAMFHSRVSKFNVVDATPFGRDVVEELAEACRKHGMKLGLYYSHDLDWHERGGGGFTVGKTWCGGAGWWTNNWDFKDVTRKDFDHYFETKSKPQVREILTQYGDLCLLWFDIGFTPTKEQSNELYDMVRKLQPGCLINSRIGCGKCDYTSAGDNEIPNDDKSGILFETPATLNDTWGYKPFDQNWKSAKEIRRIREHLAARHANYLLNVGPDPLGRIPSASVDILREARERPRTKVAFTFDDGFKDGITVAAPILEKYGYRGMFCIPPGCVDAGNGLSWDDVRELMRRGHEISLHDGDPVGLCRKGRRDEAKAQLIRGRDRIREMTGVAPRFWTPPGQQISPDALALVKECGMITTRADRPDHGKATVAGTSSGVGAWLDQQLRYHPISIVLMCHAVADPGYNSFGSAKQFEDYVKEVKEREEKGLFDVVTYPELEPSEIQAIASTPKWTLSYRDGEGHPHTVDSAELSYSVKTNGPNMWCEWKGAAPFHVTMNYVATLDGARIWGWIENASKDCIATAFSGPFVAEQTNGTYKEVRDFEMGTPYAFEHTFELTPKKRFWELPVPIFYKN